MSTDNLMSDTIKNDLESLNEKLEDFRDNQDDFHYKCEADSDEYNASFGYEIQENKNKLDNLLSDIEGLFEQLNQHRLKGKEADMVRLGEQNFDKKKTAYKNDLEKYQQIIAHIDKMPIDSSQYTETYESLRSMQQQQVTNIRVHAYDQTQIVKERQENVNQIENKAEAILSLTKEVNQKIDEQGKVVVKVHDNTPRLIKIWK